MDKQKKARTKARRIRINKPDIDKAREELLRETQRKRAEIPPEALRILGVSPELYEQSKNLEKPIPKDRWEGDIYIDSYGKRWVSKFVNGQLKHFILPPKNKATEKTKNGDFIVAKSPNFVSGKITPIDLYSLHGGGNYKQIGRPRQNWEENALFWSHLNKCLVEGLGIRGIHRALKDKGFKLSLRTVGRLVKQQREEFGKLIAVTRRNV